MTTASSARTRTRLVFLDAARDELAATGELRPERVAERAGRSTAAFYKHFPTKNDALAAAFGQTLERQVTDGLATLDVERLIEHGLEPVLRDLLLTLVRFQRRELPLYREGLAAVPRSEAVREVFKHWEGTLLAGLARFVVLGQRIGRIRPGDADALATAWLVQVQGWHNPHLLGLEEGSVIEDRLVGAVVAMLAPDAPAAPADGGEANA